MRRFSNDRIFIGNCHGCRVNSSRFAIRVFSIIFFIAIFRCSDAAENARSAPKAGEVHVEFVPHPTNATKKVELFWAKPNGEGPYPALLYIHGHQEEVRNGGAAMVATGRLGTMASRGYVAASVSQPGYGKSDGPPDFCGPFTQQAVVAAINFLRHQPFVKADKIALYGYSRGSTVAAMVAAQDPSLAAAVLGAGAYDFFQWYPTPLRGIDSNIREEAGTSDEAFRARSAAYHAEKIKLSVLLLHGAKDERIPVRQAELFAEKLKANGTPVRLKIFPNAKHAIPIADQYGEVYPFLYDFLN